MRAYLDDSGDSYFLIEKFVRLCKCHRNILDMEVKYLKLLEREEIGREEIEKKLNSIRQEIKDTVIAMREERAIIEKEKEVVKRNIENKKKVKEEIKRQKEEKKTK